MKKLATAGIIVVSLGFIAATLAQDRDDIQSQGELMKCSPPSFMLVADVDMKSKTLTAMAVKEMGNADRDLFGYHMTFNLGEIMVTNARRVAIEENEVSKLKGKLVVLSDGKEPLNALYLGLFREDTVVISRNPVAK